MARLSATIFAAVLMALVLGVGGERKVIKKRDTFQGTDLGNILNWICQDNPFASYISMCSTTTIATSTSTSTDTTGTTTTEGDLFGESSTTTFELETTTSTDSSSSSSSASPLERAYWCRFNNGTYVSLGYTFMYTACALCQCTQSHAIRCTTLQCMATYCIDNSSPSTQPGQCCSQCAYEAAPTACVVNGISFPTGTIITTTADGVYCWCELGGVECRKSTSSVVTNTTVYVIVIILCALLIFVTLLCGGCALFYYYYYYQYNQQASQQAYEQYWNSAGWQPMDEEAQVADASAQEKEAEAEQNQFEYKYPTGNSAEFIPPPYALYNGSYVTEQNEKDQKYM